MNEITREQTEKFVKQVINIERKYGYELTNIRSTRQEEIAKWLNKFIAEEFTDDNQQNRS
jgi:ribosome recycling factor